MEGKGKVEIEKRERRKEKKQWIGNVRRSWWSSITLGCLTQTMDIASLSPKLIGLPTSNCIRVGEIASISKARKYGKMQSTGFSDARLPLAESL